MVLDIRGRTRVVVLGRGQIGSAVVASLQKHDVVGQWFGSTDWSSPRDAARSTMHSLEQVPPTGLQTCVLWAAGAAGMSSTEEYCERSLDTMVHVVEAMRRSPKWRPAVLHVIGSAGATAVGVPRWSTGMVRAAEADIPYVRLKIAEEAYACGLSDCDAIIHRVSSVYGPPGRPGRSGMVTVLVRNAAQNVTTPIFGSWSTLRNYVHADDVGSSVAESIIRPADPCVRILASRRSHTISELVKHVVDARRRPVPIRLIRAANADHITIDPGVIHPSFRSRPLDVAVRQMVLALSRDSVRVHA
jgi:nucleoside-diphosphate-sugar epimerase